MKQISQIEMSNWKPVVLFAFLALALLFLTSCGDDDSGPSRTDLLVGKWVLDEINGVNVPSTLIWESTFDADGDYDEDINNNGVVNRFTGEWEWNNDQTEITIDYDQNFADWELDVDELTAEELEVDDGTDTYLFTKDD